MKKVVSIVLVLLTILTMSFNAMAAKVDFVESIEYKGAPILVPSVDADGKNVIVDADGKTVCEDDGKVIVVTPVSDSSNKVLADAYKEIKDKGTELFTDLKKDNMVVRDLFDVTTENAAVKEHLEKDGSIKLTFDINTTKDTEVVAYVLVAGVWKKVPVVNNNDGTVTATLSDIGPVAFLVEGAAVGTSPDTGDTFGNSIVFWSVIMTASLALVALLVVVLRRQNKSVR